MYGACSDGRRWQGRKWLSGPNLGQAHEIAELGGPVTRYEGMGLDPRAPRGIRLLVGMPG